MEFGGKTTQEPCVLITARLKFCGVGQSHVHRCSCGAEDYSFISRNIDSIDVTWMRGSTFGTLARHLVWEIQHYPTRTGAFSETFGRLPDMAPIKRLPNLWETFAQAPFTSFFSFGGRLSKVQLVFPRRIGSVCNE